MLAGSVGKLGGRPATAAEAGVRARHAGPARSKRQRRRGIGEERPGSGELLGLVRERAGTAVSVGLPDGGLRPTSPGSRRRPGIGSPGVAARSRRRSTGAAVRERAVLMPCTRLRSSAAVAGLPPSLPTASPQASPAPRFKGCSSTRRVFSESAPAVSRPHRTRCPCARSTISSRFPRAASRGPSSSRATHSISSAKYGVKAFAAPQESAALRYEEVSQDGLELMLQEYIPGPRPATTSSMARRPGRPDPGGLRSSKATNEPFRFRETAPACQRADRGRWGPRFPPLEGLLQGAPLSGHLQPWSSSEISEDGAFQAAST